MSSAGEAPNPIILNVRDLDIERNGDDAQPYIDIRLHDDRRPEEWPSIFASITLTPDDARSLAARLIDAAERHTEKENAR